MEYFGFQKEGIAFLAERKTALLADDMGLGKTIQIAGVISQLEPKIILILTLAPLKINWLRELSKWVDKKYKYHIVYKIKETIPQDAQVIICNYDLIIHKPIFDQLKSHKYNLLVLDEAHNLSNIEAKRTKKVYLKGGLVGLSKRVYALTGTPVRNRPKDFYTMLRALAPETIAPYLDYERYALKFCDAYYDSYGVLQDRGASNEDELNKRLQTFMLRRRKEDVLKELPKVTEKIIELERTEAIEAVISEEENLQETSNSYSPNADLGTMATIRRQLAEAKLPQCVEYIENVLANTEKVFIVAYHRGVIFELMKQLKDYGTCEIVGGYSPQMKQVEIDRFVNNPDYRVMIGQIIAAGQGIDGLQKVASHIIFVEIDWVPSNIDQIRDRLNRIGQLNPVTAHYLVIPDTLESTMLASVIKKGKVITRIVDKKQIGEKTMIMETQLDRIANALEAISEQLDGILEVKCGCEAKEATKQAKAEIADEVPKNAKPAKKPKAKKEEPKEEETEAAKEDDLDLGLDTPNPAKVTIDDVREAINNFIGSFSNQKDGKLEVKAILAKNGYERIPEIQEQHFQMIIDDLNRGK